MVFNGSVSNHTPKEMKKEPFTMYSRLYCYVFLSANCLPEIKQERFQKSRRNTYMYTVDVDYIMYLFTCKSCDFLNPN